MPNIKVKIITPEGISFDAVADLLVAPAVQGSVGILPHHIPFFTKLEPGELKIKIGGQNKFFAITGGFMDVSPNSQVTILTDSCSRSEELNEKTSLEAKRQAEYLLTQREKISANDFAKAEASLRKALLELKVTKRRKERNVSV